MVVTGGAGTAGATGDGPPAGAPELFAPDVSVAPPPVVVEDGELLAVPCSAASAAVSWGVPGQ